MKRLLASVVIPVSVAILATSAHAAEDDARAAIEEQATKFEQAFNAGDAAGVADLYTEDAALFPPGSPRIDGRQGVQDFWAGAIQGGVSDLDLETVEVQQSGDMAVEVGTLSMTAPAAEGGGRTDLGGKFLVVWQRGEDGAWRLHRDIWNMGN